MMMKKKKKKKRRRRKIVKGEERGDQGEKRVDRKKKT